MSESRLCSQKTQDVASYVARWLRVTLMQQDSKIDVNRQTRSNSLSVLQPTNDVHPVSMQQFAAVRGPHTDSFVTLTELLERSSERVAARSTAAREPHTSSESPVVASSAPRTTRCEAKSTRGDFAQMMDSMTRSTRGDLGVRGLLAA